MDSTYDVKKIFGYNLKNLRESKGLTQEQLAEYLNLSEQNFTISGLRAEVAAGSACDEQDKQGENPFNASNQAASGLSEILRAAY